MVIADARRRVLDELREPVAAKAVAFLPELGTVQLNLVSGFGERDCASIDAIRTAYAEGRAQEKIFDVAWAGERVIDAASGKLPAVGSTVDVATATYRNTIGAAELSAVWQDPEFQPQARAFYYVRVLEIPTPRWSTFDAVKLGTAAQEPAAIQERAWSSPIWFVPAATEPGA